MPGTVLILEVGEDDKETRAPAHRESAVHSLVPLCRKGWEGYLLVTPQELA